MGYITLPKEQVTGIILGYPQTMNNIFYYDLTGHHVKLYYILSYGWFDEKATNAQLLHSNAVLPTEILDMTSSLQCLDISQSPFTTLVHCKMHYETTNCFPFGIELTTCTHLCWAYVSASIHSPIDHTLHNAWQTILGSYVISISDTPIFSTDDIDTTHQLLCAPNQPQHAAVTIVHTPECCLSFDDAHLLLNYVFMIFIIYSLWLAIGEGMTVGICHEISFILTW